jgi:hypothetical protein
MGAVEAEGLAIDGLRRRPPVLDLAKEFHGQEQASPEGDKRDSRRFGVGRERTRMQAARTRLT